VQAHGNWRRDFLGIGSDPRQKETNRPSEQKWEKRTTDFQTRRGGRAKNKRTSVKTRVKRKREDRRKGKKGVNEE